LRIVPLFILFIYFLLNSGPSLSTIFSPLLPIT
jgi:hypothetical protein